MAEGIKIEKLSLSPLGVGGKMEQESKGKFKLRLCGSARILCLNHGLPGFLDYMDYCQEEDFSFCVVASLRDKMTIVNPSAS